ncbi:MAG: VRR-NUC domain-containing protein [Pseudomonadota bacterium]|nr:VRR-NUC domain-containing protein [Pseudomonadota bacterium]
MRALHPSEHQIQSSFVQWCFLNRVNFYGLHMGFAIPNGGLRNKRVAIKLKEEGVRAGVLDWCLPIPQGKYIGLFIEFKSANGALSNEQKFEIKCLKTFGWKTAVCRSLDEAIDAIKSYYGRVV